MKIPFYAKWTIITIGLIGAFFILYIGREVIIPVFIALLFALLMLPFAEWMERKRLSRAASSFIAVLAMIVIILGFSAFVYWQIDRLAREATQLEEEVQEFISEVQTYIDESFGISPERQEEVIEEQQESSDGNPLLNGFMAAASTLFMASILLPMSMFFMLFYRSYYMEFLYRANPFERHEQIRTIVREEKKIIIQYMRGIFTVVLILAVSNVTFLSLIGLEQPLLFGVIAAVLNIVPIVGTFLGSLLPVLYALVMKDSLWFPLGIALYFWILQILESNVITPNVVGTKVRMNPYAIILAIFIGNEVWGPAGMVLFIPMLAIIKVVFRISEPLRPYGFLLTDPGKDKEGFFTRLSRKVRDLFNKD